MQWNARRTDITQRFEGGAGDDTIHSDDGNDVLVGLSGNQQLFGDADNDNPIAQSRESSSRNCENREKKHISGSNWDLSPKPWRRMNHFQCFVNRA